MLNGENLYTEHKMQEPAGMLKFQQPFNMENARYKE